MPSLLRSRGGRIAKENSGSLTHQSLQTEPSFKKLHASKKQTEEALPHQYHSNQKASRARKFTKGQPTHDETFHEPLVFGPNYQHTLAGKKHFSDGGKCAAAGDWIKGAIKHPGALHKSLHVPKGQKIPLAKI